MGKAATKMSVVTEKVRKTTSGPVRDKARTMNRLVSSVGKVIQKKGYPGLTIANIAKESGLDRRLIYTYFGSVENLIETYVKQKDYWNTDARSGIEEILLNPENIGAQEMSTLLKGQFEAVLKDKALQKIIHWEIGEKNKMLRRLSDSREEIGEQLFQHLDQYFEDSTSDLRAILALQVGGLYYLSLHAKSNGSTFCGIDINKPEGEKRIKDALDSIVAGVFEKAGLKNGNQKPVN